MSSTKHDQDTLDYIDDHNIKGDMTLFDEEMEAQADLRRKEEILDPKVRQALENIHTYLGDEHSHFWENCECGARDDETDIEEPEECTCEVNKHHILRDYIVLGRFLWPPEQDAKDQIEDIKQMEEKENAGSV